MGRQTVRNLKELQGKPQLWRDVVATNVASLSGTVTPTTMSQGISGGANFFRAPRAGFVESVVADITPAVTSGVASVAVYHGSTMIASGQFSSTNSRVVEQMFSAHKNNLPVLASGTDTHVEYSVITKLNEDGQAGRAINVRVGLAYRE